MTVQRHRRRRMAILLGTIWAAGTLAACGSGGDGSTSSGAGSHAIQQTLPAEIVSQSQTFSSGDQLRPVNEWHTSSHRRFTQVEAGAITGESSVGSFVIFRYQFRSARQTARIVKVVGSGPLRITGGPEGARVEASAQRNGDIEFTGSAGVRGTLHLADDTVTLRAPG